MYIRSSRTAALEVGFTKGMNAIGDGQPTVTAQVKSLKSAFDVKLFHRAGKFTQPTDTGETLYGVTRNMFGYQQESIDFLQGAGQPSIACV